MTPQGIGSLFTADTYKNARDFILGKPAESEPSPETSTVTETSAPAQTQPRATFTSSRSPMRCSNAQVKTQLANVLNGTGKYDPIELDNEDDDIQEVSAPSKSRIFKAHNPPYRSPISAERRTQTHGRQPSHPSAEEKRLLGRPEDKPEDAVTIEIPSTPEDNMGFATPRTKFVSGGPPAGGLRPINTMNGKLTRNRLMFQATRGVDPVAGSHSKVTPQKEARQTSTKKPIQTKASQLNGTNTSGSPTPSRPPADEPPNKRRRIEDIQHSPSTLSAKSAHPPVPKGPPASQEIIMLDEDDKHWAAKYGFDEPKKLKTRPANGVRETPLRGLAQDDTGAQKQDCLQVQQRESPDDLMDTEEDFTKNARLERVGRRDDSEDELFPTNGMTDSRTPRGTSWVFTRKADTLTHTASRTPLANITPRSSKVASDYDKESPDQLSETVKSSKKPARSRPASLTPTETPKPSGSQFVLRNFVCLGIPDAESLYVEVDKAVKSLAIHYKNGMLGRSALFDVPVSKIHKIQMSDDDSFLVVRLELTGGIIPGSAFYLDFTSTKVLTEFLLLMGQRATAVTVQRVQRNKLEKCVSQVHIKNRDMSQSEKEQYLAQAPSIATLTTNAQGHQAKETDKHRQRRKLDSLDLPPNHANNDKHAQPLQSPRTNREEKRNGAERQRPAAVPQNLGRSTRSQPVREVKAESSTASQSINLDPRRTGEPWKRPLIYPPDGQKRETVTWDDLGRLEDDEFLNDSLVGLFIRYLQAKADPEQVKRMHFFNTFFYEALLRPTGEKGNKKTINYKAVASWTKNINLFHRDYVIVPVNENYHWYVMIICNLNTLQQSEPPENGHVSVEADDGPETNDFTEEAAFPVLKSDLINYASKDEDEIEALETPPDSAGKKRGRQKREPRYRKYQLDQPVIITLDSLNGGRSSQAGFLKDYIAEEGREKHGLTIDGRREIDAMTAKNIPLQNNFSDCGLYLCMYLEQFMRDPSTFVKAVLQRDPDAIKWPKRLSHGVLRQRFYDMLIELQKAQGKKKETERKIKVPRLGQILIRQEDLLSEEQRRMRDGLTFYDEHDKNRRSRPLEQEGAENNLKDNGNPATRAYESPRPSATFEEDSLQHNDASIDVDEDSLPRGPHRKQVMSHYFSQLPAQPNKSITRPADSPIELAQRIREGRSPHRSNKPLQAPMDLLTSDQEQPDRNQRSVSVSTDFLCGDESYMSQSEQEEQKAKLGVETAADEFEGFSNNGTQSGERQGCTVPETVYGGTSAEQQQMGEDLELDRMLIED